MNYFLSESTPGLQHSRQPQHPSSDGTQPDRQLIASTYDKDALALDAAELRDAEALLSEEEALALALEAAAEAEEDALEALLLAALVVEPVAAPAAVLEPDPEAEEVALPLEVEVQVADAGCRVENGEVQ
ncbi:uncharacterized protein Z520_06657 [Fonsecaea multimorphosa CBS 102226]|uniref:Uncharacterized protein n=1 Tax=Fonsecaea multimorphosa CBS 102226 TaxID=1442371 RepID=A0A0D2K3X6_9EURO|nr:uncharacterized protein Z520_06657 [Fonsecaea multimorphosa CBS 102226]KIX97879.1 hypothetical protein Z520_06657 [Fonsecaea multimorphosa CBS 102226]OAL23646.1 hypothetical protein AYO22_06223 [Fonsecaea multimorphosa]